jgi:hypothetical protein
MEPCRARNDGEPHGEDSTRGGNAYLGGEQMVRTLVRTDDMTVAGRNFSIAYFELRTPRGARRYSAEILLGQGDCIILDDDSLANLVARAARLAPATLYSRELAGRQYAA